VGDEEGGRRVGEISPGRRELEVGGGGGGWRRRGETNPVREGGRRGGGGRESSWEVAVWMIEEERRGKACVRTTAAPSPAVDEEVDALEPGDDDELDEEERRPSSCWDEMVLRATGPNRGSRSPCCKF